jgi:hypothetical protein
MAAGNIQQLTMPINSGCQKPRRFPLRFLAGGYLRRRVRDGKENIWDSLNF